MPPDWRASVRLLSLADQDGPITLFFTSEPMLQATLVARPGTDPRFVRLGCRVLFGQQAMDGFGTLQIGEVTGGHTLDVMVVPPGADNPLASSVGPFYVRP